MNRRSRGRSANVRRAFLEELYHKYNHYKFIPPDPLEFVWRYSDPLDREIAGLLASSLAYGRVAQIKKSAAAVLDEMGPSPRAFLEDVSREQLLNFFHDFKHRFTTPCELTDFILGIKRVVQRDGSLQACFMKGLKEGHGSTIEALGPFARELSRDFPCQYNSLLPQPDKKSACKRLHLFLRWMVRQDEVDPGGWTGVSPAALIVPLDTHMFSLCSRLDMTCRAQADIRTACEITEGFRRISASDPVRYDFALTRLGIRPDADHVPAGGHYECLFAV